jgi:hypothetical protein
MIGVMVVTAPDLLVLVLPALILKSIQIPPFTKEVCCTNIDNEIETIIIPSLPNTPIQTPANK